MIRFDDYKNAQEKYKNDLVNKCSQEMEEILDKKIKENEFLNSYLGMYYGVTYDVKRLEDKIFKKAISNLKNKYESGGWTFVSGWVEQQYHIGVRIQ
ncbi:hypothetical protein [Brevibacillus sp. NRS-1366]|uniref:hypothetical protein n=1 Tax=Brevibacillus sp. NRS-1366 TaxID=3233899 RepID=UPI003D1B59A1